MRNAIKEAERPMDFLRYRSAFQRRHRHFIVHDRISGSDINGSL
jgi:hypothetical protein